VNDIYSGFIPPQSMAEQWDVDGLQQHIESEFNTSAPIQEWLDADSSLHEETLRDKVISAVQQTYDDKCERLSDSLVEIEKQVMLQVLDMQWKDHLLNMDHLRQGIGLRAYAQKNPKQEYKRESFELFQSMLQTIKEETIRIVARVEPVSEEQMAAMDAERKRKMEAEMKMIHADSTSLTDEPSENHADENTFVRQDKKVGRNEPCPCGSGKKYKQCHGKL
jgi:preprotein translocase subunit SecA